ncbi:GNAT family N-acetyltransferase [Dermacoccus nishinomiyaensis]
MSKKNREERREARREEKVEAQRRQAARLALASGELEPSYSYEQLAATNSTDVRAAHRLLVDEGVYHGQAFANPDFGPSIRRELIRIGHPDPSLGRVWNYICRETHTGDIVGALHARLQHEPLVYAHDSKGPAVTGLERNLNINSLAVDPDHRGSGIATHLLGLVEADARAAGYLYLTAYGEGDEQRLRALYQRAGFTCEPRSRDIPQRFAGPYFESFQSNRDGFHIWKKL